MHIFGVSTPLSIMYFLRKIIILSCFSLAGIPAMAQKDTAGAKSKSTSYFASYPQNMVAMAKTPIHWSADQWLQFGGSIIIVGVLVPTDEVLNIPFEKWTTPGAEAFGDAGDVVGGVPFQFGLTGAALGVGLITKNKKWQNFALDNLQAQLFTGGLTWVFKELTHRARPESGAGNFAWYGPFHGQSHKSFFSGHTSLSFSTATMIFLHTGKKWWIGALTYGTATAVGISRMQQQKHWASDVVAGALIGTTVANFIYKQQENRRKKVNTLKTLP
jgi:membrane-associated phospholipid phosphatase